MEDMEDMGKRGRRRKQGKTGRGVLAIFLAMALALSGTGCNPAVSRDVPELVEPVSRNETYSPVRVGSVGDTEVLFATVVPTEYGHCYHTSVTLYEIAVEVGDHVKAGDVLAYADVSEAKANLSVLEEQLALEQDTYRLNVKIANEKKKEIRYSDAKDKKARIAVLEEETRYEGFLHERQVKTLKASIAAERDKVEEGTLRARHDGQVTFKKNLSYGSETEAYENVVVVGDMGNRYLELQGITVDSYEYGDYKVKYAMIDGTAHDVKEIPYSAGELALAKKEGRYPYVRLQCRKAKKLTLGDTCLVYFRKRNVTDVLVVHNDSVHSHGDETYVYVKAAGGQKERRAVAVGTSDGHYTEITGGLREGELVHYSSADTTPADYGTYTVARSDFEVASYPLNPVEPSHDHSYVCESKHEGTVAEIAVSAGDKVKKGDLLYVIDTGQGKAAQTEMSYRIRQEKDAYKDTMAALGKELSAAKKGTSAGKSGSGTDMGTGTGERSGAKANSGAKERECAVRRIRHEMELARLRHAYELKQMNRQYESRYKGNDGTGKVSVYAEHAGTVANSKIRVGSPLAVGSQTMFINARSDDRLVVFQRPPEMEKLPDLYKKIASVGETVTIDNKGRKYQAVCKGYTIFEENQHKVYLYSEKGRSILSYNKKPDVQGDEKKKLAGYYLELKEGASGQDARDDVLGALATYAFVKLKKVVVIPNSLIHEETDIKDNTAYYVWRAVGDALVKQYIVPHGELSNENGRVVLYGLEEGDLVAG